MWRSLRSSYKDYSTLWQSTQRQFLMIWLHLCLKPALYRHYFFKNGLWLVSGNVCTSYKERSRRYKNGWLVFFHLPLHTLSINNQVLKWKQWAIKCASPFWFIGLWPQDRSSPLVTTTFLLNSLTKMRLTSWKYLTVIYFPTAQKSNATIDHWLPTSKIAMIHIS